MIETKYLIIIGVIVCLLVLYYFYDEIANIKKSFLPTYQKTMALEAKVMELDKRTSDMVSRKSISRTDSPPLSITYYSDMVKNGNLSVKYADLSDTEAEKLLGQINKPRAPAMESSQKAEINSQLNVLRNRESPKNCIQQNRPASFLGGIPDGELSDVIISSESMHKNINETDSFDVSIGHLVGNRKNFRNDEYQEIFDGLEKELVGYNKPSERVYTTVPMGRPIKMAYQDSFDGSPENNDFELDSDIIRSISESIQYADMSSENSISDIPIVPKKKQQTKTIAKDKQKRKLKQKIAG